MRNDLSTYTGDTLMASWAVTFSGVAEYYVNEEVQGVAGRTVWGPIPSKEIAYDLIQERRSMFQKLIAEQIPALRKT